MNHTNTTIPQDRANDLEISYNRLNLIEKVERNGGILAEYSYLADGTKCAATDDAGNGLVYVGSLVYKKQNGSYALESAAFSGGRFVATETASGTTCLPHCFVTDHLGSVRVVVNAQGEVVERNDYYPFGLRWNDSESQISDNRYRYNAKEEQTFVNVPYIDYGARMYDPKFRLGWNTSDPLAEKYYPVSPYAFCANNPVKYIDSDGRDVWEINQFGEIINRIKDKTQDAFFIVTKDASGNYQRSFTVNTDGIKIYNTISFEHGTIESQRTIALNSTDSYDIYKIRGDDNSTQIFEFLSHNTTVEWSQAKTGITGNNGLNFVTTAHSHKFGGRNVLFIQGAIAI
ncbi:JAB-like toxin 1 domain-containing protein [uncultured Alistipes sp.]|uniref:JAB-like toxin 1 domain-containing protein n=1 Tax=uncultured Alistipes sp. TaxID=538949 RepID=UPI0025F5009A|nr:JAB-like toxin 1 domain-containing protein [uncultured Alistipes sp.]